MCVHTESAESLFQKELNRRGINGSSLDTDGEELFHAYCCFQVLTSMVCSPTDRQGQPSNSKDPAPAPQFASRGNEGGGQLERSRKLNSEGLEVRC